MIMKLSCYWKINIDYFNILIYIVIINLIKVRKLLIFLLLSNLSNLLWNNIDNYIFLYENRNKILKKFLVYINNF